MSKSNAYGSPEGDTVYDMNGKSIFPDNPRIIVGVDGSPSSVAALRHGAKIAEALHLDLDAVTAWNYPIYAGSYGGGTQWGNPYTDMQEIARATLDEVAQKVFGDTKPDWYHSETRCGGAATVLLDESEKANMIIVGSRGHGGVAGLLLGSVSTSVSEHANCPVLIQHGK